MEKTCNTCSLSKPLKEYYPQKYGDGYGTMCRECHRVKSRERYAVYKTIHPERIKEYATRWRKNNPERYRELGIKSYRKRRYETLLHYSEGTEPNCQCCGETTIEFLSIDHINGGGNKHLREHKIVNLMAWLRANNYPEGYQILCHNCNFSKGHYGQCPHTKGTI